MIQLTFFLSFKKYRFKIFYSDQSEKQAQYASAIHNPNIAGYTR